MSDRRAGLIRVCLAAIGLLLLSFTQPVAQLPPTPAGPTPAGPTPAGAAQAGAAQAGLTQSLQLDLQVNGYSIGKIGTFEMRGSTLRAQRSELTDLGIRVPGEGAPDASIALSELPDLTWRLDGPNQRLFITAAPGRLLPTLLQPDSAASRITLESGTGAALNYDVNGNRYPKQTTAAAALDLRLFSPWGVASTGVLGFAGGAPGGGGGNAAVRLDSTYTFSDPDTLRRYRAGDFITVGLGWTRAIRLGGAQVTSDFTLRPDLVTFPLPSVSGSVAVPSTVDVLANGNRIFSRQVAAGPFEIPQLPVVTGAGTISMTVTDALGRQRAVTLPFYASSALLAPGLQTFSAEVGAVRRNFGTASADYGMMAASGTYRRGLTSAITVEAAAEGSAGVVKAGAGVVVNLFDLAVLNLALAGSTGTGGTGRTGRTGMLVSAGLQRTGQVFSAGVSAIASNRNFRDVASLNGDPVPRLQLSANAGVSMGRYGAIGVAYASVDRDKAQQPVKLFLPQGTMLTTGETQVGNTVYYQPAQHAHVLSVSYSVQIGDMSFYATGFRDFVSKGANGVLLGVTIPLGERSSASLSGGSGSGGRSGQIQAVQSPVSIGDVGYQLFASDSSVRHEFAQLQYKSPWALLTAGADRIGNQTALHAESQGALAYAGGGLFASNTINDSFAVVDTNGLAGVRVLHENRDVGRTNASGRLLVPDLRSFDVNRIAIDPADVPLDSAIADVTREVRPQDRSGVVVRFAVRASHAALLRIVDAQGVPILLGSTAALRPAGAPVPVGYDGSAYMEDLKAHNVAAIELPNGKRCSVRFDYTPVASHIPTIGPLRCVVLGP